MNPIDQGTEGPLTRLHTRNVPNRPAGSKPRSARDTGTPSRAVRSDSMTTAATEAGDSRNRRSQRARLGLPRPLERRVEPIIVNQIEPPDHPVEPGSVGEEVGGWGQARGGEHPGYVVALDPAATELDPGVHESRAQHGGRGDRGDRRAEARRYHRRPCERSGGQDAGPHQGREAVVDPGAAGARQSAISPATSTASRIISRPSTRRSGSAGLIDAIQPPSRPQ